VWEDIGGPRWGGKGILFQLIEGTSDVTIEDNTGRQRGSLVSVAGPPHKRFVFKHNLAPHNEFGIFGHAVGVGTKAIDAYFPDAIVVGNIIVGGDEGQYPVGNHFPNSLDDVLFKNLKEDNFALTGSTGSKARPRSKPEAGVDFVALCAALGTQAQVEQLCGKPLLAEPKP
jgi:hypothetical protein